VINYSLQSTATSTATKLKTVNQIVWRFRNKLQRNTVELVPAQISAARFLRNSTQPVTDMQFAAHSKVAQRKSRLSSA